MVVRVLRLQEQVLGRGVVRRLLLGAAGDRVPVFDTGDGAGEASDAPPTPATSYYADSSVVELRREALRLTGIMRWRGVVA